MPATGHRITLTDTSAQQAHGTAARSQQALLTAGALQQAILTSANFSIIATDEKGIIQLFNVGAERMLGYTAAEVVNKASPSDLHDPLEVAARACALSLELATPIAAGFEAMSFKASRGVEDIHELTYVRKNGSRFPAIVSITALRDEDRNVIGYLLIGSDNSARKQDELKLSKAMAAAENANLGEIGLPVEHEPRAAHAAQCDPRLRATDGIGFPPPTDSQQRSIEQILKAGWHLLELINEILDLAQIEAGKLRMSVKSISINEILTECRSMIEPQARTRDICVTFPPDEIQVFVDGDRTRLKQVLINLLSNAVKYNKAGGSVTVNYDLTTSGRVRIRVSDTGQGLGPDKLVHLFQPFNRLGKETGIDEGTGIGLMVSKRLIELMKGVIGVQSTEGVGSEFWIELERSAQPRLAANSALPASLSRAADSADSHTRTVLYVEDNPANLMLVEEIVARREDIRLISALDGNLGVQVACASLPDVILMDINLPGISGVQALKLLRANPATAHIPVIALSSNAMPRDIERGLAIGFFRYLTKPIKINELLDTLDVALTSTRPKRTRAGAGHGA